MKAMIFAAGLGTRLKPITDTMPKAMVPIDGKPLIQHTIEKLKENGVDEIIVNVHHFADQIIQFLQANNNFGIHIEISDERNMLLETGGGIKKAAHFFNDGKPFLIHNVDILSNANLQELYNQHLQNKAIATLLVSSRTSSRHLLFNQTNQLCGWINENTKQTKPEGKNIIPDEYTRYAFSGIHVISPEIFPLMNQWTDKFSIIDFYLSIADTQQIAAYTEHNMRLIDVGKIESLSQATEFLQSK